MNGDISFLMMLILPLYIQLFIIYYKLGKIEGKLK